MEPQMGLRGRNSNGDLVERCEQDRVRVRIRSVQVRRQAEEQGIPAAEVGGWQLQADVMVEIDRVLRERITDPVGPEFMAPPVRPQPPIPGS